MSTQHTKGPWVAVTSWGDTFIQNAEGDVVFFLSVEDGVKTADLQLMAAAPENYACNKELAKIVRELCATYGHPLPAASLDRSDAAIAKATGDKA
jgi:hypothetical protein